MKDENKTKKQLINELVALRQRAAKMEKSEIRRKQAEEELRESQATVRALLNTPVDAVFLINSEGIILDANETTARRLGSNLDEIIGHNAWELIPPDVAKMRKAKAAEVIKAGKPVRFDDIRQGFWNDIIYYPVFDERGKVPRIAVWAHDITERKKAEELLQNSERELKIRNQILEVLLTVPDERAYAEILKVVLEALESNYGTFGYFDEGGNFVIPSMTREIYWEKCQVPEKEIIFEHGTFRGIWARALKEKKTLYSNEGPFNTPEGHIPIKNTMVTPIIYRGKIISTIHIANKSTNYNERDAKLLETIAHVIAPVLNARLERDKKEKARKKTEEALRKSHEELEHRVKERTAKLSKSIAQLTVEITERKIAEEKLLAYRKQLQSLASQLSLIEERERHRIATVLHDHIGHALALCKIKLGTLRESASPAIAVSVDGIRDLIEQTIQFTRSLTFELSSPILYELGFEKAIEWLGEQILKQHNILFHSEDDEQPKPLKEEARVLLFQIVRELLVNITKHAKARNVKIFIRKDGNNIRIDVEDNGVGFDISKIDLKTAGFGLFSIRERLGHLNGHLQLKSEPSQGTQVTIVAPLSTSNS